MGTITLRSVEDKLMIATDSNGHSIVIGRSPDEGFTWYGMKPSDLLLISAAACSAYDVVEIMAKQKQPMRDLKVECRGDQMESPPYTFTRIHLHYFAYGNVDPQKLEKAIRLAEEKYCSVLSTLRPGVPISSDFQIQE
jgi:putative redox protein